MILTKILEAGAKDCPQKPALTMQVGFRNITLNFKQVYEMAQKVATLLEQNDIKQGDPVLICAPNSPFWICVFWGCMLKGAVAVPLNIQSTKDIIDLIIKQTNAKIMFDFSAFRLKFPELKHFNLDFLDEELANTKINFKKAKLDEDDLVQIMYTSGTTGDPKGVMLTHKNISANINALRSIITTKPSDKILSILPLSHIYEQTIGFLLPYSNQIHIIYTHSHAAIRRLLHEHKITLMIAVPEFLQLFMNKIEAAAEEKGRKETLKKLMSLSLRINKRWFSRLLFRSILKQFGGKLNIIASGGAPLDIELEKKWSALGITILQGYGLTETSPVISSNTEKEKRYGSVGKIVNNIKIKFDDAKQILVKGPSVFPGYYKNKSKTNAVLIDGWFNTEDIGELDSDDFLYIRGRKKYMIIGPGGQNVYPSDIEFELRKVNSVKDSCVIGIEQKHGSSIHAVLIMKDNSTADPAKVIDIVNDKLASYQQINSWSIWHEDDFPRTATHKVKKNKVIEFVLNSSSSPEQNNREQAKSKFIKILSRLTNISADKINDKTKVVRELNLDSLMRVELVATVETEMNKLISESDITPTTTVGDLEEIIKNQPPTKEAPRLRKWPRFAVTCLIRAVLQQFIFLLCRIFMRVKVKGLENLKEVKTPVIFMPNHVSYLDPIPLAQALPMRFRNKLAFGAARDFLYEEVKFLIPITELLFNSFPVQREGDTNIKLGLEYMGKMLDSGFSVVLFPEGKVSPGGKMQPLKGGAGLIATNMFATIIPVKIEGAGKILPYEKFLPQARGTVTIIFGKPLTFNRSDSQIEAAKKIELGIKEL